MKWKNDFDKQGKEFQKDTVGNILYQNGQIKPKKCQKCKINFESKPVKKDIIQKLKIYECYECEFKSNTGDGAFDHKIDFPDHEIKKTIKERIAGQNIVLEGTLHYISTKKNDISILCGDCIGK